MQVRGASPAAFAAGTLMLFQQNLAPTGWTKQATHHNKAIRLTTGTAGSGGTNTFDAVFAQTVTGGRAITEAQLPPHDHTIAHVHTFSGAASDSQGSHSHVPQTGNLFRAGGIATSTFTQSGAVQATTDAMAAAGAHTHLTNGTTDAASTGTSGSGNGTGAVHDHGLTMSIQYVDCIIAMKN